MTKAPQTESTYIISGGLQGADRLKVLANALWPYTYPFLLNAGLKSAMQCLDVGCGNGELTKRIAEIVGVEGHVKGVDFDESMIRLAAKEKTDHLSFTVLNIEADPLPAEAYDFIFCRFILSHLRSPDAVLKKLYGSLRKGGVIAIEDVEFKGHFCFPPLKAFDDYVSWYEKIGTHKGGDPEIGPTLLYRLTKAGFQDVHVQVQLPTFNKGDGKQMALLTLHAIREAIIKGQIATTVEIDYAITELEKFTSDPQTLMSLPRIYQLHARKK